MVVHVTWQLQRKCYAHGGARGSLLVVYLISNVSMVALKFTDRRATTIPRPILTTANNDSAAVEDGTRPISLSAVIVACLI